MSDDLVKRLQANGDVLRHIEAQAAEIAHLRAERDNAMGYLSRLLKALHPTIEPLPDLLGVCTQVDNVQAGQREEIARLHAALAAAQVTALKKAADIARQFAQSEGWSGASALRLRNCIIAEAAVYAKTGAKNE